MTDPNSNNFSEGAPTNPPLVFEPAPAPTTSTEPAAPTNGFPPGAPTYQPGSQFTPIPSVIGPPVPTQVPLDTTGDFSHRIPRWRWFMSLLLIGTYPALVSLISFFLRPRGKHPKGGSALPGTVQELLRYLALDLSIFAVLWGIAWLFSRANKDELLLRWRGGLKPIWSGFLYALGLRAIIMVMMIFAIIAFAIVFTVMGHSAKELTDWIKANSPQVDTLFPKGALSNPIYLFFALTGLSFVAAGLREELWRTSCLAPLRHLLPDSWDTNKRWITSIVVSSIIFGLGHVYQGAVGVVMTTIIGMGLGTMTWRLRSIWPSVWAHGFFDAASFILAAIVSSKGVTVPPTWFGW